MFKPFYIQNDLGEQDIGSLLKSREKIRGRFLGAISFEFLLVGGGDGVFDFLGVGESEI